VAAEGVHCPEEPEVIMRRSIVPVALAVLVLVASPTHAAAISKTYEFKANTTLEVGLSLDGGLRIDWIRFDVPDESDQRLLRGGRPPVRARIAVSNLGTSATSVGVSMALLDGDGALVGAANGGTRLFPLRKERQIVYEIVFDGATERSGEATVFKLAIEPKN